MTRKKYEKTIAAAIVLVLAGIFYVLMCAHINWNTWYTCKSYRSLKTFQVNQSHLMDDTTLVLVIAEDGRELAISRKSLHSCVKEET